MLYCWSILLLTIHHRIKYNKGDLMLKCIKIIINSPLFNDLVLHNILWDCQVTEIYACSGTRTKTHILIDYLIGFTISFTSHFQHYCAISWQSVFIGGGSHILYTRYPSQHSSKIWSSFFQILFFKEYITMTKVKW